MLLRKISLICHFSALAHYGAYRGLLDKRWSRTDSFGYTLQAARCGIADNEQRSEDRRRQGCRDL